MQEKNTDHYDELFLLALNRLESGMPVAAIEKELLKQCDDVVLIAVVLKEARNAHDATLRKEGFRCILIGCLFGFSGFVITLFNFNSNRSIDFAMYGLTTAGLLIVFWGLFKLLG